MNGRRCDGRRPHRAGTRRTSAAGLAAAARARRAPLGAVALLALSACGGGPTGAAATADRHASHRDAAIQRCLDRCAAALGPGHSNQLENQCQAQCYPYLVDTDQIREEIELREGDEPGTVPPPEGASGEPDERPIPPPEPAYETERFE